MKTAAKKILFVGDATARSPLSDDLSRLNTSWNAQFCRAGDEALALLTGGKFDAVVADDRLSDVDGFQFLNRVQEQSPYTHRLIVCDLAESKAAMKTVRMAHHCVPKPWDSQTIQSVLERTFALSVWLSNETVRGLVQNMSVLPSPPTFYFEIVRALRSPELDLEDLGAKAAKDPALTAKLLQVSNSAALGLRHKVTRVQDAISYLGLETTRSLVLLAHTFSYADKARAAGFSLERLWHHSILVGSLARKIARLERASSELVDECFLAGLLHDIGKLLLAVNRPEEYSKVIVRVQAAAPVPAGPPSITLWQAEMEAFGATHAEVGAQLMAIWNLPLTVVEALALHHRPAKLLSSSFSPLAAVHVADACVFEFSDAAERIDHAEVDLTFLWDVGLAERLDEWRECCRAELRDAPANS